MKFKDKAIIVTGAGRGIGREITLAFAKEGAQICICDIDEKSAASVSQEAKGLGADSISCGVDVSDEIGVNTLVETVVKEYGKIDVLVNNAGISPKKDGRRPNLVEIDFDEWCKVISVNLTSVYLCCKAVFPHMIKRNYGRIINISSSAALDGGYLAGPHYVASKGGVRALTMNIAREVAGLGITINAIAPGRTLTPMAGLTSDEKNREALGRIPVGRFAVPEDIAHAALFLASEASQYITGTTLNVTGGQVLN